MKKSQKAKKGEVYQILVYMEEGETKLKRFRTTDELGKFIDAFNKVHPESQAGETGYWTDFAITGITGDVHFFTDGMEVT